MKQTIFLGADHAGFKLKEHIKKFLKQKGYVVKDEGNLKYDKNDDYSDYAFKVAEKAAKGNKGILFCGSAEGICIAANKVKGIRAVPVWSVNNARLTREHNDANILCLAGGDMLKPVNGLSKKQAEKIVLTWLETKFSKEQRHMRRINKIKRYEN